MPKISRTLIFVLIFFLPLIYFPYILNGLNLGKFLFLAFFVPFLFILFLSRVSFREKVLKFKFGCLEWAVLIYFLITSFGYFFAKDKIYFLWGPYGKFWPSFVVQLLLVLLYFLILFDFSLEKESLQKIFDFLVLSGFFVLIWQLWSILGIFQKISYLNSFRFLKNFPQSPLSYSVEGTSIFGAIMLFLAVLYLSFQKKTKTSLKKIFQSRGIGFLIFISFQLFYLILVDFKPAWQILAFSLGGFLIFSLKERIFREEVTRLNLPILIFLFSILFSVTSPLKLNNLWKGNVVLEPTLSQRISWHLGIEGVKENPVFGAGFGNFPYIFSKFKPQRILSTSFWQARFERSGSHFAEVLATQGASGFLAFLTVLFFLFWFFFKNYKKLRSDSYFLLISFFLFSLVVAQLFYYQTIILAFLFYFFLAIFSLYLKDSLEKELSFKKIPELSLIFTMLFWGGIIITLFFWLNCGKIYIAESKVFRYLNGKGDIESLKKAKDFVKWHPQYHYFLSRAYLAMAQKERDSEKAVSLAALSFQEARKAADISPNNVLFQKNLGEVSQGIQPFSQDSTPILLAQKAFERATTLEPKNPVLLVNLGIIYSLRNDYQKAESLFKRSVELLPNYFPGHFQLGVLYFNQSKYELAEKELSLAVSIFPNIPDPYYFMGQIKEKQGDKKAALLLYKKALSLNSKREDIKKKIEELEEKGLSDKIK